MAAAPDADDVALGEDDEWSTASETSTVSDLVADDDGCLEWAVDPRSTAPSAYLAEGADRYFDKARGPMPGVTRIQNVIRSLEERAAKESTARRQRAAHARPKASPSAGSASHLGRGSAV
jgi:hypothetical protein